MKPKELAELGVPQDCMGTAVEAIQVAFKKRIYGSKAEVKTILRQVVSAPEVYKDEATFCNLANAIIASRQNAEQASKTWGNNPIGNPNGTYAQWGEKDDEGSMEQMKTACELPVAVQGEQAELNEVVAGTGRAQLAPRLVLQRASGGADVPVLIHDFVVRF